MHDNRRYVKLALICLAGLLPLASTQGARAEIVTSQTDQGVLAIAADGTPYVAYTIGRQLYVATRAHPDRWQARRLGGLPGGRVLLAGIAVSERPRRSVSVLAEDEQGAWVVLARGNRIETLARAGAKSSFGPAGLTLDRRQRPAVAYAVHRESGRTSLRLITFDAAGRRQARTITREGFPSSVFPPGAAPVLVRGRLHVVETFTEAAMSGAIDWGPKAGGDWEGQFLFASVGSSPLGLVGAVFLSSTLWSAWTLVSPGAESQDISVSLTSSAATQETSSLTHGIFVAIANGGQEPEVGAYDWVDVSGDWRAYAAIVIAGRGAARWQLDGRLAGYAIGRGGSRQVLLSRESGLEWFRAPAPGLPGIEITMGPVDAGGTVTGTVVGATSGTVDIYHEIPHAPRELVATSPVAADGSFHASGLASDPANLYRAVYVEPRTGIPFGFLPGVPAGVGLGGPSPLLSSSPDA